MLSDKQIVENFHVDKIIKNYPRSGQKRVLLIQHHKYGKVILKIVEGDSERVRREIAIVTENHFGNVPQILEMDSYDCNDEKGIYIFEEFIEGDTLTNILKKSKLEISDALDLANNMLSVMVEMEEKRIVHRDIKPDNIIKKKNEEWYLIDFGIARVLDMNSLTLTEARIGPHTPGYGAPELFQYSKKDIDNRADLFSLGVVLFEAVTGSHPFLKGDELNRNEIWYNTITVIPQSVVIDGDKDMLLMGLIQTFMQKHISRRPKSVKQAMQWFQSVKEEIIKGGI
ncbi:serine/threonine-protein kinase [Anaerocolumna sp. AGMB13025]|uniref:serine/threonine-protein kinase n=1 Tax=Anaerocolumna sp. AGMB13025 TaxID=3039116 RepID=UPI00241EA409|nr:serine/threonine-protein kinase [Anaerocolumna sp. AGMB13025]WFR57327.1 serine/threonine-protein kinase [Anaerocolumna sp. AGMB13025]